MSQFRTILVDPPWPTRKTGKRSVRPNQGTQLVYPTMSLDAISDLPVDNLSGQDSLCFLWSIDRYLAEAHNVLANWGFKKHCTFVWNKPTGVCPFSVQFCNEFLLLGYKGRLKLAHIGQRTHFAASVTAHSRKPEESYALIERIGYAPRVELFARGQRDGWLCVGNEINGQDINTALADISAPLKNKEQGDR